MAIDDVIKEATVKFQRPIGRVGSERLLEYLGENLPGDVTAEITYGLRFSSQEKSREFGTLRVTGSIAIHEPWIFDSFTSKSWDKSESYISGIMFNIVPGWNLSEYGDKRKLWSDIREIIGRYFKENRVHRIHS